MNSPQHQQHKVDLTDKEFEAVEAVAKELGMTVEEAVAHMAQQSIHARYRVRIPSSVLPFRKRKP